MLILFAVMKLRLVIYYMTPYMFQHGHFIPNWYILLVGH